MCAELAIAREGIVLGSDSDFLVMPCRYADVYSIKFAGVGVTMKVFSPEQVGAPPTVVLDDVCVKWVCTSPLFICLSFSRRHMSLVSRPTCCPCSLRLLATTTCPARSCKAFDRRSD